MRYKIGDGSFAIAIIFISKELVVNREYEAHAEVYTD